jgi:methylated-DNA-[protein]-cysteine S-methyltransferase
VGKDGIVLFNPTSSKITHSLLGYSFAVHIHWHSIGDEIMGQSGVSLMGQKRGSQNSSEAMPMPDVAVFSTKIGWMGLVGRENQVSRLVFGHSSANEIWQRLAAENAKDLSENDWNPGLRSLLEAYAEGEAADFSQVLVDLSHLTEFQKRVVLELRKVPYGETLTYGELAGRAGSPKAARAVGSVMAQNRVPLVIPCHRVVGSAGHLGGFSAPRGVSFKKQLLELEAHSLEPVG